jgi:hypothetical protein
VRELEKPIGRVFRRLRVQRFLAAMVWSLGGFLALATIALGIDKLAQPLPGPDWLPFAIAGGLGFLTALLVAVLSGPSRVDAAVAIDREFGLNERLSTTLTLPDDMKESAAGRALVADTIKHVSDLDVADKFSLQMPRRAWIPLVPVLFAVLLLFAPEWAAKIVKAKSGSSAEAKVDQKLVAKQSELLKERISTQRKEMDKTKFAEAERLLAEVEKAANELAKAPPAEKDKALIALNKLTDAVKDRQKQLGTPEQINRQLQNLKDMNTNGPAGEFMKDLAKGNFEKAATDLKKLQEKLTSGKMSEAEKKALKEQIGAMSKQLKQLANLDERKKQLEKAQKNGGISKEQFEKEMAKLGDQQKSLEKLQKLADQMAKAAEQMNKGDLKKAAEQLGMSQKQMEEMAKQMQELQSLDSALADLQDAKDGMSGNEGMNQLGEGMNSRDGRNQMRDGRGGRGRGQGDRAEAPDDVASYDSKVKQQIGKGKAVFEGTAPPQGTQKGVSVISSQIEAETSAGNAADALTNQKVPRSVEKHVRGYFDLLGKD